MIVDRATIRCSLIVSLQIISDIIRQFYFWVTSLRSASAFEFDLDEENNHRCKVDTHEPSKDNFTLGIDITVP